MKITIPGDIIASARKLLIISGEDEGEKTLARLEESESQIDITTALNRMWPEKERRIVYTAFALCVVNALAKRQECFLGEKYAEKGLI